MENIPVKRTGKIRIKLLLAGVFLAALAAIPLLDKHRGTEFIPGVGSGSSATSIAGGEAGSGSGSGSGAGILPSADAATGSSGGSTASKSSLPVRLKIPSLGINTNILQVGLTASGNMDTPKSSTAVAWYKLGPKPGEKGNAVIAGHVNTRYDPQGVFYHLDKISIGDEVDVLDSSGKTFRFKVIEKKTLSYDASPTEVFGATSATRLNLVTCTGIWLPDKKVFDKRLVVFTELVK